MKNTFILMAITFLYFSCKKDDIAHQTDLDKSNRAFTQFKNTSKGNYEFQTNWGSWTGISGTTTITIKNNQIVKRTYTVAFPENLAVADSVIAKNNWVENLDEINTHPNSGAFDAVVFDTIYARAKNIWLKKSDENNYTFQIDSLGIIKTCGYYPKGCQDDCFNGVHVNYIKIKE